MSDFIAEMKAFMAKVPSTDMDVWEYTERVTGICRSLSSMEKEADQLCQDALDADLPDQATNQDTGSTLPAQSFSRGAVEDVYEFLELLEQFLDCRSYTHAQVLITIKVTCLTGQVANKWRLFRILRCTSLMCMVAKEFSWMQKESVFEKWWVPHRAIGYRAWLEHEGIAPVTGAAQGGRQVQGDGWVAALGRYDSCAQVFYLKGRRRVCGTPEQKRSEMFKGKVNEFWLSRCGCPHFRGVQPDGS